MLCVAILYIFHLKFLLVSRGLWESELFIEILVLFGTLGLFVIDFCL